jgi:hypothetical protein
MSKVKELVMNIVEMHEDGASIPEISDRTGLPQDVIFDMLRMYGDLTDTELEDYTTAL